MPQVNITINGKVYRMACDEGQQAHLEALAERLNRTIDSLRQSFGAIGDQRLIVMAALTMSDDLSEADRRVRRLERELAGANEAKAAVIARYEESQAGIARLVEQAAARLENFAARLVSERG